jgi:hypothetical protein
MRSSPTLTCPASQRSSISSSTSPQYQANWNAGSTSRANAEHQPSSPDCPIVATRDARRSSSSRQSAARVRARCRTRRDSAARPLGRRSDPGDAQGSACRADVAPDDVYRRGTDLVSIRAWRGYPMVNRSGTPCADRLIGLLPTFVWSATAPPAGSASAWRKGVHGMAPRVPARHRVAGSVDSPGNGQENALTHDPARDRQAAEDHRQGQQQPGARAPGRATRRGCLPLAPEHGRL